MMSRNTAALTSLVATRTLGALADGAMLPFVVVWAHGIAGLGGVAAGVLFAVQAIGEMGGGLIGGTVADRWGHRRVLLTSTAGMAVGYGLLSLAGAPVPAIALFLVAGTFESAFHPTIGALVGGLVPDERLEHAFGLVRVGAYAGRIAGPLLGAATVALLSLRWAFATTSLLLLVALLVGTALLPRSTPAEDDDKSDDKEENKEGPQIPPGTLHALANDRGLALLVLGGGLLSIAFTWWEADGLVLVRQQRPLTTTAYATLFTIAAAAIVVFQLPITRAIRRTTSSAALGVGAALQAAGLATLSAAASGYPVLVVAVLLMAVGEMVYAPTISTLLTRRAPRNQRAAYQAALSITEDVGSAVGPTSGLALGTPLGARAVWLIAAGLSLAAGVLSSAQASRPPRQQPPYPPAGDGKCAAGS